MPKPEFDKPFSPEIKLRKLYVKSGHNALELEGDGIPLNSPLISALIAQVFAAPLDPADQAKIAALTTTLSRSADTLEKSVEEGK